MESPAIKKAKEGWLVKRQDELNKIFGADLPYEINWKSFSNDDKAVSNLEFNGAHQVSAAFRILCNKDENKKLVNKIIKKICLKNVKDPEDKGISIKSGKLQIACAFAVIPAGKIADKEIREFVGAIMEKSDAGDTSEDAPIKTEWVKGRQEELKDIVGKKILYDIDSKSFSCDQKATDNLEFNGAHQISAAFRILCGKEDDKKNISKKIKKIRFRNVKDISEKNISLDAGVLELACVFASIPNGRFADREIREFLNENLK